MPLLLSSETMNFLSLFFKAKQIFSDWKEESCANCVAKQEIIETLQLTVKFYCLVEELFEIHALLGVVFCQLVSSYRYFEGSSCLHLQPKNEGLTIFSEVRNIPENLKIWKQFPSELQNLRSFCSFTEFQQFAGSLAVRIIGHFFSPVLVEQGHVIRCCSLQTENGLLSAVECKLLVNNFRASAWRYNESISKRFPAPNFVWVSLSAYYQNVILFLLLLHLV
jgi:hypothetical protein